MAKHTNKSKTPKVTLSKVSAADYIRLGPEASAIKAQTSPKRWAQIVKTAHSQGWTVASALDANTPAALKQRTNKSIRSAAQRQVQESYAPAYAELDVAGKQAEGMRQKRLSDQRSYDQWSAQKASEIAAGVNAAQQKYFDTIKQSSDAQIAQAQQTAATFAQRAGAGGISDLSGSTAQADVTRGAQAAQGRAGAATELAASGFPVAAERATAIRMADLGGATQRRGQIEGEYGKTMSDIFTGRMKLNTERASAQVNAYSDLLKTEMDKASANRDFQGLQAQLKSKADIAEQKNQQFLLGQKGLTARANLAAATTRRGQTMTAQQRAADRREAATQRALDRASREGIAAKNRAAANVTKNKPQDPADVVKINNAIDKVAYILTHQQKGKDGKKGTGYLRDPASKQYRPARQVLLAMGASDAQVTAGLAHASGNLLTPAQRRAVGLY